MFASLHMETPSPHNLASASRAWAKAATIAPPAAVVNAVNDALRPTGAEITQTPATPERVLGALIAARDAKRRRRLMIARQNHGRRTMPTVTLVGAA